jgi:vesicle-associated membrane protein 7
LQSHVDEVKGVMTQNIDKILQRGDKLDDLVDKTADLENSVMNSI